MARPSLFWVPNWQSNHRSNEDTWDGSLSCSLQWTPIFDQQPKSPTIASTPLSPGHIRTQAEGYPILLMISSKRLHWQRVATLKTCLVLILGVLRASGKKNNYVKKQFYLSTASLWRIENTATKHTYLPSTRTLPFVKRYTRIYMWC